MKRLVLAVTLLQALSAFATDRYDAPDFTNTFNPRVQQDQQQAQGQLQGQGQYQSNGQLLNTNTYQGSQFPRQTAGAYAPPVIIPNCANGGSAGVQRPTFGVSFGFASQDGHCEMLADAEFLKTLGMVDTAKSRLCQDAKIAKAMRDSGEWNCVE